MTGLITNDYSISTTLVAEIKQALVINLSEHNIWYTLTLITSLDSSPPPLPAEGHKSVKKARTR